MNEWELGGKDIEAIIGEKIEHMYDGHYKEYKVIAHEAQKRLVVWLISKIETSTTHNGDVLRAVPMRALLELCKELEIKEK